MKKALSLICTLTCLLTLMTFTAIADTAGLVENFDHYTDDAAANAALAFWKDGGMLEYGFSDKYKNDGQRSLWMKPIGQNSKTMESYGVLGIRIQSANQNWSGAKYLEFWMKNDSKKDALITVEMDEGNGRRMSLSNGTVYLELSKDCFTGTPLSKLFGVPAGFEGRIRIPLDKTVAVDWYTGADKKEPIDLSKIVLIQLECTTTENQNIDMYFDSFRVSSEEIAPDEADVPANLVQNFDSIAVLSSTVYNPWGEGGILNFSLDGAVKNDGQYSLKIQPQYPKPDPNNFNPALVAFHPGITDWRGWEYVQFWFKNDSDTPASFKMEINEAGEDAHKCEMTVGKIYRETASGDFEKVQSTETIQLPAHFSGRIILPLSLFKMQGNAGVSLNPSSIWEILLAFDVESNRSVTLYVDSVFLVDLADVSVVENSPTAPQSTAGTSTATSDVSAHSTTSTAVSTNNTLLTETELTQSMNSSRPGFPRFVVWIIVIVAVVIIGGGASTWLFLRKRRIGKSI